MKTNKTLKTAGFFLGALAVCALLSCTSGGSRQEEEAPIITSATYQHTLYTGKPQPITVTRKEPNTAPDTVITYFPDEKSLTVGISGTAAVPSEVGTYFVRIERPAGNGYAQGRPLTVEYAIQKGFVTILAEERARYDGTPKSVSARTEPPLPLTSAYFLPGTDGAAKPIPAPTEKGTYRVRVTFAGDEHYFPATRELNFTIE